jgi:hypothetical protein
MRSPSIIIFIILLVQSGSVFSQYYDTGEDPASLKWVQVKTGRFTVIYPESYGEEGIAYAKSLDDAYYRLESLFPEKKFRIPVILHNYTIRSNGYVAWAPKRMEIYPTPEQNTIPLDPVKQLTIHELTHVLQMVSLNQGFSKGMSYLLGQQFYGVVAFLLPLWFLEGDAVFAESALTGSGRGHDPSFQKQLKAILVDRGPVYSYDMSVSGSYKNFVPDYYQSGFQMVTWAMAKYDHEIWNKVLDYTADYPFTINPVNISLSKNAGLSKKNLYAETLDSLRSLWTRDESRLRAITYKEINPGKNGNYINYYSPVAAGSDSIIAVKTSLARPPVFVLVTPSRKKEFRIHTPGQIYPWFISYGGGKLVWVETQNDPRWANREYSVIKVMDPATRKVRRLSVRSRYLSASVSPDGKVIAASENTVNNRNSLVFIDAQTGAITDSRPTPHNEYLQHPQWAEGGRKITVITLTDKGEGILSYDIPAGEWETLIEPANNDLQSSFLRNDSLYFISSVSGTDNIYLRTKDDKIRSITNSRFGVSDLSAEGGKIIFCDYTFFGNNICINKFPADSGRPYLSRESSSFLVNRFDIKPGIQGNNAERKYTPVPYRKWQHLFRFHSWMPFYADIQQIKSDPASVRPGFTLLTQNNLSTLVSTIGYEYSVEKKHVLHTNVTWKGLYPEIESQLDYGNFPTIAKFHENVADPNIVKPGMIFTNTVSVPLSYSSGSFYQYFNPSVTSEYMNNYIYLAGTGSYDYGQTLISGRLYFSNYSVSALRDIYPRWAQTFDLNYTFAPFDRSIYGTDIALRTSFYFPGFFPNNGIKLSLEKEKQNPEKYVLGSRVTLPRGYVNIISQDINFVSVDYALPLAYPDFNIASLLYIKRIRATLFYDYAQGTGNTYYENSPEGLNPVAFHNYSENFSSAGIELMADLNILRIPYMISGGVQGAWPAGSSTPVFSFLLNIDLFGLSINRGRL